MKFFIDTADINEIREGNARGWVDGVTTNPTLVAKTGKSNADCIAEICREVKGPVSAEVISLQANKMYEEGKSLAKIADNVVVKIPMCEEGLIAVRRFAAEGIKTNVTLVFSPLQALMVAKAGASMVSPFVGRLDDISHVGMDLIEEIQTIYSNYDFQTEILVASVRHPIHVLEAGLIGADIVTCPLKVMKMLVNHPLTDAGIQQFLKDAEKLPK
ncbi:MAG: fructose-6-phosphate aldolase [Bdellovibrionales bacterium]|mgnify:CR=1 FL=1|jgi:transaldolase|nr:fructose-6-phosphate aldolase [Bdellovibrionales bacterium]MBL7686890.1 fructose-6-phosphate aldolase [Pseudobdellovibrionaceae bacterium]